jgi:hypothetical protein
VLRLPGTIAIRYLLGKKSRNAVNIISGIVLRRFREVYE